LGLIRYEAPEVQEIVRKFNLRRRVGFGHFSFVFNHDGDEDTVMKLTCDPASYKLLADHAPYTRSPHFPKVVNDFGKVGETDLVTEACASRESLYLVELERLYEDTYHKPAAVLAEIIRQEFHDAGVRLMGSINYYDMDQRHPATLAAILREMADGPESRISDPSIGYALRELAEFVMYYRPDPDRPERGAGVDLHGANFMIRTCNTGIDETTLVLSDPVLDRRIHEHYSPFCDGSSYHQDAESDSNN